MAGRGSRTWAPARWWDCRYTSTHTPPNPTVTCIAREGLRWGKAPPALTFPYGCARCPFLVLQADFLQGNKVLGQFAAALEDRGVSALGGERQNPSPADHAPGWHNTDILPNT